MKKIENYKTLLWVDDTRNPFEGDWIERYSPIPTDGLCVTWVKSYNEFTDYIIKNGLPDAICFDHDLGIDGNEEKSGMDCAKYIVDYCADHKCDIPAFSVQSSNPSGRINMKSILKNYHKFFLSNE